MRRFILAVPLLLAAAPFAAAQETPLPPPDRQPVLQLDLAGPTAAVTALAFSADGSRLYAAGLDKTVRVWARQPGGWELRNAYRVPVGPGNAGAVNALALSADGRWLAVGGRGPMRGEAGDRVDGVIVDSAALSDAMRRDLGVIHVFDLTNPAGGLVLRDNLGEVRALAFAPERPGKPPLLVSAALEAGGKSGGVLRLWDVAAGKVLAERRGLPATPDRPGLAVWHTGDGPRQVRVAVAWPEADGAAAPGDLRVWDAADDGKGGLRAWGDLYQNRTLALVATEGAGARVLGAGFGGEPGKLRGRVRLRALDGDTPPGSRLVGEVAFPPEGEGAQAVHFVPLALTPFSAAGDGVLDHAAVVLLPLHIPGGPARAPELALLDLRGGQPREVGARLPLAGLDPKFLPVLAAAPKGRQLAVGGFADHALAVFAVADLLGGKREPAAVLRGAGSVFPKALFTGGGKALWLGEDDGGRDLAGGLVFDLEKRRLLDNPGDLRGDVAGAGTWSVTVDAGGRGFRVLDNAREAAKVALPEGLVVTRTAVLGDKPAWKPALSAVVAVALADRANSRFFIQLYDAATGTPFRRLTGHLQEITSLSFSAARPLLVSTALDQSVCVWGLTDLEKRSAAIDGLLVADDGGKVLLRVVTPDTPAARAGVKVGDAVEAVGAADGDGQPVKDAAAFYWAVHLRQPGEKVALKLAGKPKVVLPLVAGIDERKPLFTLAVTRAAKVSDREWVGWSPAGPYDASGAGAERRIGWLAATGDPKAPTTFAAAARYRDEFRKVDILRYLAERGRLDAALEAWQRDHPPPPPPQASLRVELADAEPLPGRDGLPRLRQPRALLRVALNPEYPLADGQQVRWRLRRSDGKPLHGPAKSVEGAARAEGQRLWTAQPEGVDWAAGDYVAEVEFLPRAEAAPLAVARLAFCYQPPAPRLRLRVGDRELTHDTAPERRDWTVDAATLPLTALLEAPAGQAVTVSVEVRQGAAERPGPEPRRLVGAGSVEEKVTLPEGVSRVRVRAVNVGALPGAEGDESDELAFTVRFKPPPDPVPAVALKVEPAGEPTFREGRRVVVVEVPKVRFLGEASSPQPLVAADWVEDGKATALLAGGPSKALKLDRAAELKPGQVHSFRLTARSRNSDAAEAEVSVVYLPPLPHAGLAALPGDGDVFEALLKLSGPLEQPEDRQPFEAVVRVTPFGKEATETPARATEDGKSWGAAVTLAPGPNRVEVWLRSVWREPQRVALMEEVVYRRPPEIVRADDVAAEERAVTDVVLLVRTPAGLPPTRLLVDGRERPFAAEKVEEKGGQALLKLTARVPVKDEAAWLDALELAVANGDGLCRQPARVRVKHRAKPLPAPAVALLAPAQRDSATDRPSTVLHYRVRSPLPLLEVVVQQGDRTLARRVDFKGLVPVEGEYVVEDKVTVALAAGPNPLRVTAVSDGGRGEAAAVVGYAPPPVLVRLTRLTVVTPEGKPLQTLEAQPDGTGGVTFAEAADGFAVLEGEVRWSDPGDRRVTAPGVEVVAYVNLARQLPVELEAATPGSGTRRFRVPVFLAERSNRLELELVERPGRAFLPPQQAAQRELRVDCARPLAPQRLHVLIVGVNAPDGEALKGQVLAALGAKEVPRGFKVDFTLPAFTKATLHGVLTGEVGAADVVGELAEVERVIREQQRRDGWVNDVVLLYYQGGTAVDSEGRYYLHTTRSLRWPQAPLERTALPCAALPATAGVRLLLLNVTQDGGKTVGEPTWGGDPRLGFLRYAWNVPPDRLNADPRLPALLAQAIARHGRLGTVVDALDALARSDPAAAPSTTVLPPEVRPRRLGPAD